MYCFFSQQDMPRQRNGIDCGVFICMYANYVCMDKVIDFNQSDMPNLRKRMVYEIANTKLLMLPTD